MAVLEVEVAFTKILDLTLEVFDGLLFDLLVVLVLLNDVLCIGLLISHFLLQEFEFLLVMLLSILQLLFVLVLS